MLIECTDKLLEYYPISDNGDTIGKLFRAVAGKRLSECRDFGGLLESCNIIVDGENEELTREIYLNCMIILTAGDDEDVSLSLPTAVYLAKQKGKMCHQVSKEDLLTETCQALGIEGYTEEDVTYSGWNNDPEEEEVNEDEVQEDGEDLISGGDLNEIFEGDDSIEKSDSTINDSEKVKNHYEPYISGAVEELLKRYTSLFESGYELLKPYGILSLDGLVSLSGSSRIVKKNDISISSQYSLLAEKLNFIELDCRSNTKIASAIYNNFVMGNSNLVYFPNKMLEYAYGRKAPSGDNQDSLNTYENHADANNWAKYRDTEVKKSLYDVVSKSVVKFITITASDGDYYNVKLGSELSGFLNYMKNCLSLCLIMSEYKTSRVEGSSSLTAFRLRLCDPRDVLGDYNLVYDILKVSHLGSSGQNPVTASPRIEEAVLVKEYYHEFNHDLAEAMPLFAYKAYEVLNDRGMKPYWDNMILGKFEDGSILVNGKKGVGLNNNLVHFINAGSRSGKGVMTMNILISAILSKRNIFYLDRKPDISSLLKSLSPDMFVVNGSAYNPEDDRFKTWVNRNTLINPANIPDYLCCPEMGLTKSWDSLGDIFYMRALKLILGIIYARGNGYRGKDPKLGGEEGIFVVVDEFSNLQAGISGVINKMLNMVPPMYGKLSEAVEDIEQLKLKNKEAAAESKQSLVDFCYTDTGFYSLTFLESFIEDMEQLAELKNASFDEREIKYSDVLVLGQDFNSGPMSKGIFSEDLSNRYRMLGESYRGIPEKNRKADLTTSNVLYNIVNFRSADAFLGVNIGNPRYLAQENSKSKAFGKLDLKASYFTYLDSFSELDRKKLVSGSEAENIALASKGKYFKPFLVLNDAVEGDYFTDNMFKRLDGVLTREEIISENSNGDPNHEFLHSAVGFKGYLDLAGATDHVEVLRKGSDIANFVVQECMGYNGTWMDFITDLRPRYIFSVKDVMECVSYYYNSNGAGAKDAPKFFNPTKNPVCKEFLRFKKEYFVGDTALDGQVEFLTEEEFNDFERNESFEDLFNSSDKSKENAKIADEVSSNLVSDSLNDEVIDLDIDDTWGMYTPIKEASITETNTPEQRKEAEQQIVSYTDEDIAKMAAILQSMGYSIDRVEPKTGAERAFESSPEFGQDMYRDVDGQIKPIGIAPESEVNDRIEYKGTLEDKYDLMNLITEDIIKKFGGLDEIVSFKVVGGSIVVNGYHYRCKPGELFVRSLPYDLAQEIKAGDLSRLFDYSKIKRMRRLRDLEFDSTRLVYDYVSHAMGYGSSISVDRFFDDLRALQSLCIGKKLFKRSDYLEQIRGDDVFYNPKAATRFANASEALLGGISKGSWSFAKDTFTSRDHGLIYKTLFGTAGAGIAATAAVGQLGVKGTRKAAKGFGILGKSIKAVIDETKKY